MVAVELGCWRCDGEFEHRSNENRDWFECNECGHELGEAETLETLADQPGAVGKLATLILNQGPNDYEMPESVDNPDQDQDGEGIKWR